MDEQEKARVEQLARRFNHAMAMEDRGGCSCASATTASPGSRSPWVKLHGYSDSGVEAPYLYDPDSGDVAHLPSEQRARQQERANGAMRTITFAEEEVDRYCAANARGSASSNQGLPGEHQERAVAGPGFICCSPEGNEHHELGFDDAATPMADARPPECTGRSLDPQHNGPAGAIPAAPGHAFTPMSFLPENPACVGDREIVTGHDRLAPGELPWKLFWTATMLLVALWSLGLLLPFGAVRELMTRPLTAELRVEEISRSKRSAGEHFLVGTDPSGLPEYIPESDVDPSLPELPEGELIRATWPGHSGFQPRALSSAPFGNQLVVADDFGVYAGRLGVELEPQGGREAVGRSLRASSGKPVPTVHFKHAPPCAALEGQALKDISVVCSREESSACSVLVLHAHGRRLVECPLRHIVAPGSVLSASPVVAEMARGRDRGLAASTIPSVNWVISSDWLHSHREHRNEHVESVAVNNKCLDSAFHPNKVGCVVVGTTSGRIVQLRRHFTNETQLVPERAVQQWSHAVEHGSLHVCPNGIVVALSKKTSSIQAFAHAGKAIGEWRLPQGVDWMMLSGAGEYLYLLGRENATEVKLFRFPMPQELWAMGGRPVPF